MVTVIFYAIILIFILEFLLGRILSYLNIQYSKNPLPDLLSDIYDEQKYKKQQSYFRVRAKFGWFSSCLSFLFLLLMFVFGGYAWVDEFARTFVENEILVTLFFFGFLMLVNVVVDLPFDLYYTFVIEEKFGFNRTTPKIFFLDMLKGLLLNMLIGGILISVIALIYQQIPNWFWLLAWGVLTAFMLFMNFFYSDLIVPLFNKQTPLEAGELRTAIQQFAEKTNFKIQDIYVLDNSKRSTKANAYFTGFGRKKRIVLYDTLIQQLTVEEIVAVLAHEIGHCKHRHTLKNVVISLFSNLLLFFFLGIVLKYDVVAQAAGCTHASFHINMLVFGMLYTPVSMLLGICSNVFSRRFEYQADAFVKTYGNSDDLISALKKISAQALSNLQPHPLSVFFNYSHPTLYQRIIALKS